MERGSQSPRTQKLKDLTQSLYSDHGHVVCKQFWRSGLHQLSYFDGYCMLLLSPWSFDHSPFHVSRSVTSWGHVVGAEDEAPPSSRPDPSAPVPRSGDAARSRSPLFQHLSRPGDPLVSRRCGKEGWMDDGEESTGTWTGRPKVVAFTVLGFY